MCKDKPCAKDGYSLKDSSTGKNLGEDQFVIKYLDGTKYNGDYVQDIMFIGNVSVPEWVFAQTKTSTASKDDSVGMLGLGPSDGQTGVRNGNFPKYPSFLEKMKTDKQIDRLAYGLILPKESSDEGNILFGGFDAGKFRAPLKGVPFKDEKSFAVDITSVEGGPKDKLQPLRKQSDPYLIDTGASLSYLPKGLLKAIIDAHGGKEENGVYSVPADAATDDHILRFHFNDVAVDVPLADFVAPQGTTSSSTRKFAAVNTHWDDEKKWSDHEVPQYPEEEVKSDSWEDADSDNTAPEKTS